MPTAERSASQTVQIQLEEWLANDLDGFEFITLD